MLVKTPQGGGTHSICSSWEEATWAGGGTIPHKHSSSNWGTKGPILGKEGGWGREEERLNGATGGGGRFDGVSVREN